MRSSFCFLGSLHKRLYYDATDARFLGQRIPWQGTVSDLIVQARFPLHSGRILGLPGRILISVMGLVVAILSVTGLYLWWKKREARKVSAAMMFWQAARKSTPLVK